MKLKKWQTVLGIVLVLSSTVLYFIHYLLFNDAHHIFLYLIGDIAFVPIEVLLVTLIIHKLLEEREKKAILSKMNILVGVFFSEMGTDVIGHLLKFDANIKQLRSELVEKNNWNKVDFKAKINFLKSYKDDFRVSKKNLTGLATLLKSKRLFLMTLLQNPVLLEQETFSDLLQKLFHLEEEFTRRLDVRDLSNKDAAHIKADIWKAYKALLIAWTEYMEYLKNGYPDLFMFAVATNPFTQK